MTNKNKTKLVIAFILAFAAVIFGVKNKSLNMEPIAPITSKPEEVHMNPNTEIIEAIKQAKPLKYAIVKNARVIKLLADDKKSPLHQRWIMEVDNGITITVFYNVDIAERVPLTEGSYVEVAGELEYGDRWKDPIMHWTHDDPKGQRKAGYVILNGTSYGRATGP